MRQGGMKPASDAPAAYYHCHSRVVDRGFVFNAEERDQFHALMREYELFCEVRVLTYCVMSDHFHLLIEASRAPEAKPTVDN